jgi:serine/threonine protein kinase
VHPTQPGNRSWGKAPQVGSRLGPYKLLRQLGEGAMGVVFLAEETELDREVAVKIIAPHLLIHEGFRERFTREARALAKLNSGHVVQVYRYGEANGALFIATQLVPDGDLGHLLKSDGPPPTAVALDLIAQVAEGLADAHDAGLIHRDIKPGNILIRRRAQDITAYLGDFGIARAATADATGVGLTQAGSAVGTPAYMAPELHVGGSASVASDVYSLGCLLWQTLTGDAPYQGSTPFEVVSKHVDQPVPQLRGSGPIVDGINRILRSSMAKQPGDRFSSARAMRAALLRVQVQAQGVTVPIRVESDLSDSPKTRPTGGTVQQSFGSQAPFVGQVGYPGYPAPPSRRPGRLIAMLVGIGAVLILAVVIVVVVLNNGDGGDPQADETTTQAPTEPGDAPKDATKEEFCGATTGTPTPSTGSFEEQAEQANSWAKNAIAIGTPPDMSESERHGFELWAGYQKNITAADLESDNSANAWQEDFGLGDAGDVFLYLAYVGTACATA